MNDEEKRVTTTIPIHIYKEIRDFIDTAKDEGVITAYGGLLRCECPDYHYRKDPAGSYLCKHILAAIKKIEEEEIEEE
mgnify:FL=1